MMGLHMTDNEPSDPSAAWMGRAGGRLDELPLVALVRARASMCVLGSSEGRGGSDGPVKILSSGSVPLSATLKSGVLANVYRLHADVQLKSPP